MNKEKEEKIKEKLTSLSKEDDIELYFQKCYDYEFFRDDLIEENKQLELQLEEKDKQITKLKGQLKKNLLNNEGREVKYETFYRV